EGVLPRLIAFETFSDVSNNALEVAGMVQFLPAKALHLFECGSRIVVPAFVVPVSLAVRVGRPGKLTDVVGKFAEACLACTQCMLAGGADTFSAPFFS